MMDSLLARLDVFDTFDYTVLTINLLFFVFARQVVRFTRPSSDESTIATRVYTLRVVNVALFVLYFSEIFFADLGKQFSQTGLTLLLAVLINNILDALILRRYGRLREIDEVEYRTETYQSEVFGLLMLILTTIAVILIIINIWGMTDWLKTTSVLGGLVIILFSTKDVWAPDNINGLILLYNGDIEPGTLVQVEELNLLGIIIQTTLTQTRLRDLTSKHIIIVPNSRLRGCKVEILSKSSSKGLMRTADFQLNYGLSSELVDQFFKQVWERACELEKGINDEKSAVARLEESGNHGVTWRLCYWVKNSYALIDARFAVNRAAYDVSQSEGIELNTPLTHNVAITEQTLRSDTG